MDVEVARDVASFDPELLQLQEISSIALKDNPQIADQLYMQWLTLPETARLVFFSFIFFSFGLRLFLIVIKNFET